ncbi:hypothetical protein [Streptomyces sp. NPDC055681]
MFAQAGGDGLALVGRAGARMASVFDMPGMNHDSGGSSGMPGIMSDQVMTALNGSNADAKKLADAVVTAQTAEVEKMNKILDPL